MSFLLNGFVVFYVVILKLNNKRTVILISVITLFIGLATSSITTVSHSASNMTLIYDLPNQELTINIVHSVADPNTHYIFEIKIWKNNILEKQYNYTSQPTTSSFSYIYNVTAIVGDILKVSAECNIAGTLIKELTVSDETITQNVPAAYTCIILIGLSSAVFIRHRRSVKAREG